MFTRLSAAAALVVATALAATLPPLSQATTRGKNSAIAYARYRFVNSPLRQEIWVVNPNGSGAHRIEEAPANVLDAWPAWSPDGSKLLFSRCAPLNGSPCDGENSIWSINRDGSQARMLTPACKSPTNTPSPSCPQDGQPSYSPDGQHIASLRYTGAPGIAIGNSNFQNVHEIFPFGDTAHAPDERRARLGPRRKPVRLLGPQQERRPSTAPQRPRHLHQQHRRQQPSSHHPLEAPAGGIGELAWSPNGSTSSSTPSAPPRRPKSPRETSTRSNPTERASTPHPLLALHRRAARLLLPRRSQDRLHHTKRRQEHPPPPGPTCSS